MEKIIYLDNASTTKVDESVVEEMNKYYLDFYGNSSSKHSLGKKVKDEVEKAREKIAKYIGVSPSEIIFTSGGTESNNLAIKGLAISNPNKRHIITSQIEHPSVLETCRSLENIGYEVDYVGVNEDGFVNVHEIESKIRKDTLVVSIMHVNNEIGTIQPIEEIAKICLDKKVPFHVDAVQSFTKINLDVSKLKIGLVSVSGHKIHGPKGIGFLYVRKDIRISPLIHGGGQENNLRSGTINSPAIIGLAKALDVKINKKDIEQIRNRLLNELLKIPESKLNGSMKNRIYNNINISFYGIDGGSLVSNLDKEGICISTGSACSSSKLEESHVLKAIGVDSMYIHGSIRITLEEIDEKELNFVAEKIKENVLKLREISPFKIDALEIIKSRMVEK